MRILVAEERRTIRTSLANELECRRAGNLIYFRPIIQIFLYKTAAPIK